MTSKNLVWMDLEMTGLNPINDKIIEIAVVVTDSELNIVANGPEIVIFQPESVLETMDDWNTRHHTASGLIDKIRASHIMVSEAEEQILNFLKKQVEKRVAPLCGNSICQDRRFIANHMPLIDNYLHYRNIDVSSIKELAGRWYPGFDSFSKKKAHTALSDIMESIEELKYFRKNVFK
ncbi:MAG: oligoribonuclease [Deltaproteobacteria bacterium]|nr:oligoribonuclease [Deltaproteobacteria bacterium]